jgi:hydrophobic/amphiphilic exporter-1 (mainly G- bacteria), HAE1 family
VQLPGTVEALKVSTVASEVAGMVVEFPRRSYLPAGDQNLLFSIMLPPPGYNLDEIDRFHSVIRSELQALWKDPAGSPQALAEPGGGVRDLFYVSMSSTNNAFMGTSANEPLRVRELLPGCGRRCWIEW